MTRLAFLGAGTMGLPMAKNLLRAGFDLAAWNRTPERAEPLRELGGEVFSDPADAVRGCEMLVTMLSAGDAVVEVAERTLGEARGARWLQMSTIGLEATERCAALAREAGVAFVDAPVLGTKGPAEEGKLVILASGEPEDLDACRPVFETVGQRTLHVGPAGAGSRTKVVVNTWIVGTVGVLAETISLAERLGIDPERFFEAIDGGPLDLPYAKVKGRAMIEHDFEEVSFRLALARKDAELALAAAGRELPLPVLEALTERMRAAERRGAGDLDMAATYLATPGR